MTRSIVPLLAIALFAQPAGTAPKVTERPPVFYYPTDVGARRVYKAGTTDWTEVVSAVERKDGLVFVTVDRTSPSEKRLTTIYRMSERGLFVVASGGNSYDSPHCLLPLPVSAKGTWEVEDTMCFDSGPAASATVQIRGTVVGDEVIEVRAGRFRAVRVDIEVSVSGRRPQRFSEWYAAGVGLVRDALGEAETGALQSFTPGAATPAKK